MEQRNATLSETPTGYGWRPPEVMQKVKLQGFFKITMIPHVFLSLARHLSACQFMFGAGLAVSTPVAVDGCWGIVNEGN
jgi:hypothetical protein